MVYQGHQWLPPEGRRFLCENVAWISPTQAWYLDRESGRVVLVPVELQREEVLDAKYCDRLPPWEQEEVAQTREIYLGSDRYVSVPRESPRGEYDLMLRFAESVPDSTLQELLFGALDGPGAFGRFRRVLDRHPEEREAWARQRQVFVTRRVREWLRTRHRTRVGGARPPRNDKPPGPKVVSRRRPYGCHGPSSRSGCGTGVPAPHRNHEDTGQDHPDGQG